MKGKGPHPAKEGVWLARRKILSWIGLGGFCSFLLGGLYSFWRFFKPPVLYEPANFFIAGYPEDYSVGSVDTRWVDDQKIWVVRTEGGLYGLISICTHLACTPIWYQAQERFKCPCHGSVFDIAGDVISGPAKEPLFRAPVWVRSDGRLLMGNGLLGIRLSNQANRPPMRDAPPYLIKL